MMKNIYVLFLFLSISFANGQVWPASSWTAAVNLTAAMDTDGITDLSGLHFNSVNNRLYCVQGDGRVRILQWNATTNTFSQIGSRALNGGPEGITQANLNANEFYTIDENNYEIKRYTHTSNFSSVSLLRHWNLLSSPSPMQDTGNSGPEGIVFIPDSALATAGFVSQQTGLLYTSTKGLGGLMFVAHQDQGYVWAFDLNPNTDDDFAFVGKYKTNSSESCDLAFDRSTNLMYILHNVVDNNTLEVTDLSSSVVSGIRKFTVTAQFNLTNPQDGNANIEGFALTPKCPATGVKAAWLCRDIENNEGTAIRQDALRWFNPFNAAGDCVVLETDGFAVADAITIVPNPGNGQITISGKMNQARLKISNSLGQVVLKTENATNGFTVDISNLKNGIYLIEVENSGKISHTKWIKN